MVHIDVWGPCPIEAFDSTKYFLFITDDCTRYTWSARFDHKYQLLEVFRHAGIDVSRRPAVGLGSRPTDR